MVGFGEIVGVLATVGDADNVGLLLVGTTQTGMLQYDHLCDSEVV